MNLILSTLFQYFYDHFRMIARIKTLLVLNKKEGANHIVFNALFPILF